MSDGVTFKSTDTIVLSGRKGKGKTTLAKYIASMRVDSGLLIWDALYQYDSFPDEVRYCPKSDSMAEFDEICQKIITRARDGKPTFFVIEECEKYLRQGRSLPPATFEITFRGRNWGVGLLAVTRRVQSLSKEFFDLADHVLLFNSGLRAKEYLADMIGKRESLKVARLDNWCFLHYDLDIFDEDDESTSPVAQRLPASVVG